MIARVHGETQRGLRQGGADLRFDGLAVGGGEEVVRRIDCLAPGFLPAPSMYLLDRGLSDLISSEVRRGNR